MKCEKCTKFVDRITNGLCWKCEMDLRHLNDIVEYNQLREFGKSDAGRMTKKLKELTKHLDDRIERCDFDDQVDRAIHWELNKVLGILKG